MDLAILLETPETRRESEGEGFKIMQSNQAADAGARDFPSGPTSGVETGGAHASWGGGNVYGRGLGAEAEMILGGSQEKDPGSTIGKNGMMI